MDLKYAIYTGKTGELRTSENHYNFKWLNEDCHILFSVTQQGKAMVCHFTSDKAGLRKLKQALNEWCEFCFWLFKECDIIVGIIEKPSVFRLAINCNFEHIASFGNKQVCIRRKSWVE